jgi:5-methylcytosine-specific restriction endonuclease McrA
MKKSPLKKISNRRRQKLAAQKMEEPESVTMKFFFASVWESLRKEQRRCFESAELIYEPRTYNFHHVLPKELYPQYKYSTWNIVLLTWQKHDQVNKDIDLVPKVKARYEELLQKHQNGELKP